MMTNLEKDYMTAVTRYCRKTMNDKPKFVKVDLTNEDNKINPAFRECFIKVDEISALLDRNGVKIVHTLSGISYTITQESYERLLKSIEII